MKFAPVLFVLSAAASASAFTASTPRSVAFGARPTSSLPVSPRRNAAASLHMVADDAKVCLVTGASRGLGRAIAVELGNHGQKVVVNYAGSEDAAKETVEMIKAAGGDAIAVKADCSSPDDIDAMFKTVVDEYGTCDVLINNAGITSDTLVMRMKPEQWQSVIDINLSGVFYTTKAFFKVASKKRTGRIVNISSVVGQIGNPGQANYAAAKGGVIGLTMSNAKEFAGRGITVNCLCPGFIETDMTAKLSEDYLKQVSEGIPLKRLGKPEEVAGMCRFLSLDPAADYITGHCFNVDGGIAMGA
uniref:3-oxoacyl-[acyl-carrier-protein] reductase n=1 Tax=Pseudictyota dubia TaxID=2749911 RepID=A0A7R9WBT1_9STRA|mmetsp:Transcript_4198/g.7375  ORF Transcript_4198/g.7375 Transcript_4198/m.7375 type:complete len:302 (+) Transcript_4198:107-1012(+)|eukprot:CAMPEP_0197438500 /NCGR_PEP_ID=MMETSP1175-20131217/5486_1 /TAXON_ID=1003142 /ORGANISM="Triceratium dubium, Strain CCMP147" /LENGTH=301 /DNA_ID=CAMNT_0042968249 /DNA_START=107 /DNA_END=1012 /DNA_ORIENTATION=-